MRSSSTRSAAPRSCWATSSPELQRKRVTLGELIDDAIVYAREHNWSARAYEGKGALLRAAFADRQADDVTAEEIAS